MLAEAVLEGLSLVAAELQLALEAGPFSLAVVVEEEVPSSCVEAVAEVAGVCQF